MMGPKKKGGNNNRSQTAPISSKDNKPYDGGSSEQQRVSNRAKIASSQSWTGKLPASLLHEHCQKLKWHKPEFSPVGEKKKKI